LTGLRAGGARRLCEEPLHRGHRVGAFAPSSRVVSSRPVELAFEWTRDGIELIFTHLGLNAGTAFRPVREALDAALYADPSADN
jgi:hypothetical protein